jgi:hypothetical protein
LRIDFASPTLVFKHSLDTRKNRKPKHLKDQQALIVIVRYIIENAVYKQAFRRSSGHPGCRW